MYNPKLCSQKVKQMTRIRNGPNHGPSPIPQEGKWIAVKEIADISGLSHSIGWCAPQQGCCKLTLNVKKGFIEEALIETVGCSGMTHAAAIAGEILSGKTLLESLNSDLACDAMNVSMREIFKQLVYGRSQTAFSEGGLPIGASIENLGEGMRSQTGSIFVTREKGPRYLEMAEGYILELGLDKNDQIIGYKFVNIGKVLNGIKEGKDHKKVFEDNIGIYGRFEEAVKTIDPRKE